MVTEECDEPGDERSSGDDCGEAFSSLGVDGKLAEGQS